MKRTLLLTLLAVLVAGIAAIAFVGSNRKTESKIIETHRAGDLAISLLNDSGDLTQGRNNFIIEFKSASSGQPVDVGRVFSSSTMSMPGMAPLSAGLELTPAGEVGRYRAKSDF